jgi:hypothetical protein
VSGKEITSEKIDKIIPGIPRVIVIFLSIVKTIMRYFVFPLFSAFHGYSFTMIPGW